MSHLVHPVFWERGIPLKSKIFHYAIMILAIITLNFFLPRMLPGSPIVTLAGEEAGQMTEDERDRLMSSYNLDKSLGEQFLIGEFLCQKTADYQPHASGASLDFTIGRL